MGFSHLEKPSHLMKNEPKATFPDLGCGYLWNVMWKELELRSQFCTAFVTILLVLVY